MARDSRVDETVDALLRAVVSGEFSTDRPLPSQGELAASFSVSRLTVREAVKELKSGNILRVEHGNGTFVNTPGAWTDLHALAQMSRAGTDGLKTSQSIIEVRRIIEVGAAELCATRRTAQDVAALRHHVQAMTEARDTSDVDAFVHHDLAFHATVLRGCANPFLAAVYDPLQKVLQRARTQTSSFPAIRNNALEHHRAILDAIADRAPARARAAMDAHIEQTSRDLADYVGGLADASPAS